MFTVSRESVDLFCWYGREESSWNTSDYILSWLKQSTKFIKQENTTMNESFLWNFNEIFSQTNYQQAAAKVNQPALA